MKELLFLAHRIPYPPNKGDKIRSYHILKHLSQSYTVHLGAFIDDPNDWQYLDTLQALCGEVKLLPLSPRCAKLRSLRGILTAEALSVPYYYSKAMQAWVESILATRSVHGVFVFSSAMGQYVRDTEGVNRVIDFVDVDSDKWRQYADQKAWPLNWVYRREAKYLLRFDRALAAQSAKSLFVSADEAALFQRLATESSDKIVALENGVDTEYFDGTKPYHNPYASEHKVLVFTGAMDYWANIDAVTWMAQEVLPNIRRQQPNVHFYIVGARPSAAVKALEAIEGVIVTGAVDDVRPYLAHAQLALAPLRIARGIQNKVLEAMAMGKSLVATAAAVEGIDIADAQRLDLQIVDGASAWTERIVSLLATNAAPCISRGNREFVSERYSWAQNLKKLDSLWDNHL